MDKEFASHGSINIILALIGTAAPIKVDMKLVYKFDSFGHKSVPLFVKTPKCIGRSYPAFLIDYAMAGTHLVSVRMKCMANPSRIPRP
jgi:hypothetical protein